MNDAIKDVMVYCPNAWNQIICSEKISWLDKKEIFMKLLRITNVKSIWDKMLSDNSINILNEHVEEIFIDCNVEEIQTCINIGLKIPDLAESNLEEEKLNIIYEKRAFEFSRKNVEYVFTKEGEDAETIVIKILNEDISSYEQKVEFIAYIPSMCLKNIAMVEEHRLWSVLMENDKIVFNAKNIVELWRIDEVFTDEMRAFLLRHIAKTRCGMKWEDMITLLGENEDKHPLVNKMFKQIIEMENIGEGYVRLVTDLGAGYNTFSFDEISKEHVELLLCQTGVVHMTTANLEYVRTNMRRNVLLTWIIKRINTYISLMKNEGLRIEDELHALISDKRTDDNEKCSLLSLCKEPIEFSDKYNSIVVSEILSKDLFTFQKDFSGNEIVYHYDTCCNDGTEGYHPFIAYHFL